MLHPLRKRIGDGLWDLAVSILISFSLSMLWSRAFLSEGHALSVLVRCAAFIFVFVLVDRLPGKVWKPILYFLVAGTGVGLAFFGIGPVYEMIQGCKAMFLQWAFRPEGTDQSAIVYASYYTEDLRTLLCLIFSVMVFVQVTEDAFGTCVFMFAVFSALPYMMIQFPNYPVLPFSPSEGLRMAAPGAAGLVMMIGSRGGRRPGLLPLAAFLTAAALLLVPAEGTVDPELNRMAEQASWYGQDIFFTGENRSAFSMASTDYMPLKDRLGGSVRKTSDPVMMVTTDSRDNMYLKASSCDTYTGFGWQDTLSERGYLFNRPLNGAAKGRAFGKTQIMESSPVTVSVRMLRNASTTVFSPQRILSFQGGNDRMVLYFNRTGELYITRDLEQGDGYTVKCLTPGVNDAKAFLSGLNGTKDSLWEEVCSEYLAVSDSVSTLVRDMTMDIIFGIPDPLDRAVAIRDYLRNEYPYSLQTGTPDPNEDFVSWFLLNEKKGYCTYFASAMTIMCRIAGIPARYVVGYAFDPGENGTATITTADGHAWTEIYLEGFGWLTMDATGSLNSGNNGKEGGNSQTNERWEVAANTPVPSAAPSTVPGQSGQRTADPNMNSERNTPSPTPTVTPSPAPGSTRAPEDKKNNATPTPENKERKSKNNDMILAVIIIILCLIVLCFAVFILYRFSSPAYKASRHPERAAKIFYDAAFRICREKHGEIMPSETWPEYADRVGAEIESEQLMDAAMDYQASFYKKEHVPDFNLAVRFYQKMWSSCGIRIRGRIILKRILGK